MKTLYSGLSVFVGIFLWINIGMGLGYAYPIHLQDLEPSFDYGISYQNDYEFYSTVFNQADSHDTFDKPPAINVENMQTARITSATTISEPATMLFVGTGLISLAGFIRNHRKP